MAPIAVVTCRSMAAPAAAIPSPIEVSSAKSLSPSCVIAASEAQLPLYHHAAVQRDIVSAFRLTDRLLRCETAAAVGPPDQRTLTTAGPRSTAEHRGPVPQLCLGGSR